MMNIKSKNEEFTLFNQLSDEWWNENGKFKILHQIKRHRMNYILGQINNRNIKNLKILDVGCGGGLLCEPLCRLGANVTGMDAAKTNIEVAKIHMKQNDLKINYINIKPEEIIDQKFDVILCMEIIEHVEDVNFFIESCVNLLKPNGIIFFATLNKTLKSFALAIVGAEYVLRWLPIGTHEWEKFIKPEELVSILEKNDLRLDRVDGMIFNLL